MTKKMFTLKRFISREFFKAALLPLLFIELALVVLYFSTNRYNQRIAVDTLQKESILHLEEIVRDQARTIREQLRAVSSLGQILQSETMRFFSNPRAYPEPSQPAAFGFAPNGVYYKINNNGGSSLYYSTRYPVGPKEKKKAEKSEALDPIYQNIYHANRNIVAVYLNTFDSMNRYYPFIDDVFNQFVADMDIPDFNFYYLADKDHNPEQKPVWTEAYLDPAGQGWMMSCIAPIYRENFLEGVVGIDITINTFVNSILKLDLPWGSHAFLVDSQGTIMAMPSEVERAFGLTELRNHVYTSRVKQDTYKPEEFNLLKSKLPGVAISVSDLMSKKEGLVEMNIESDHYFLAQSTVPETGWKLMVLADKTRILKPIVAVERKANQIGYIAIGAMILFYFLFFGFLLYNSSRISSKIAAPVSGLSQASKQIANGEYDNRLDRCGVIELDEMSANYETMADNLKALYDNLKEYQENLEHMVEERTLELSKAQQELLKKAVEAGRAQLSAMVLHNIGNAMTPIRVHVEGMKSKKLEEIADYLEKCYNELREHKEELHRYVTEDPRGKEVFSYMETLLDSLKNNTVQTAEVLDRIEVSISYISDIMNLQQSYAARETQIKEETDLNRLIDDAVTMQEGALKKRGIVVEKDLEPGLPKLLVDKSRLIQVIVNLIKNSYESLDQVADQNQEKRIIIKSFQTNGQVALEISDNGIGIAPEELASIGQFGNSLKGSSGFGLYYCKSFVEANNGTLSISSRGKNKGATVNILLKIKK